MNLIDKMKESRVPWLLLTDEESEAKNEPDFIGCEDKAGQRMTNLRTMFSSNEPAEWPKYLLFRKGGE